MAKAIQNACPMCGKLVSAKWMNRGRAMSPWGREIEIGGHSRLKFLRWLFPWEVDPRWMKGHLKRLGQIILWMRNMGFEVSEYIIFCDYEFERLGSIIEKIKERISVKGRIEPRRNFMRIDGDFDEFKTKAIPRDIENGGSQWIEEISP